MHEKNGKARRNRFTEHIVQQEMFKHSTKKKKTLVEGPWELGNDGNISTQKICNELKKTRKMGEKQCKEYAQQMREGKVKGR